MLSPALRPLALIALSPIAAAQWPLQGGPLSPEDAAAKNWFLSEISAHDPGGVLTVSSESRLLLQRAYGSAELTTSTQNTEGTLFHLDGAWESSVRLLTVRLAKAEALSLDDQVGRVLPVLAASADNTTIGDLVDDRARFLSLEDLLHFRRRGERGAISVKGAIAALGRTRSLRDEAHRSTNTLVLIAAIEAATGTPIDELMGLHVFGPGGMDTARWIYDVAAVPEQSAVNYGPRPRDEDWPIRTASPLAANEGSLWLSASDATGLCRLILGETSPQPLAQGMLRIADRGRLGLPKGECAVYFEDIDRLTVWASNDRGRSSSSVAFSVGSSLAGLRYGSAYLRIGGGTGGSHSYSSGKSPYAGRWPIGTYEIFELERPLVLSHGPDGRLVASTSGFESIHVNFGSRGPRGEIFEGRIRRSSNSRPLRAKSPAAGERVAATDTDTVIIRFRVGATGVPEAIFVSLRTTGEQDRVLNDLFLVGPVQ